MDKTIQLAIGIVALIIIVGAIVLLGRRGGGNQGTTPAITVSYTDAGFSPTTITVQSGTTVQFNNASGSALWVASDPHPIHTGLLGFDAGKGSESGGSYSFTFSKQGRFGYHNHLSPSQLGTVIVE